MLELTKRLFSTFISDSATVVLPAFLMLLLGVSSLVVNDAQAADIYWTDPNTDQVLRGNLDGTGSATELFGIGDYPGAPGIISPVGVTVDANFAYWTDQFTDQVLRGNLDGTGSATELFAIADYPGAPGSIAPHGVTVDANFAYWTDQSTWQVLRGNLDGTGSATELFGIGDYPGAPGGIVPFFLAIDQSPIANSSVPEPSTLTLAALGFLALIRRRRRK